GLAKKTRENDDPLVRKTVISIGPLPSIREEPPEYQIEPNQNEGNTPETEEESSLRVQDAVLPENCESSPKEAERNQIRVGWTKKKSLARSAGPMQPFTTTQLACQGLLRRLGKVHRSSENLAACGSAARACASAAAAGSARSSVPTVPDGGRRTEQSRRCTPWFPAH